MNIKFENNELYRGDNVVIDDIQSKCDAGQTPYEICMNEIGLNGMEKVDCVSTLACPSSVSTVGDELSTRHALLSKACDFKQDDIVELTTIYNNGSDEEFKNKLDVVGDVNLGDATAPIMVNCGNPVLQKIYNDFETHCDDPETDNPTRTHTIEDLENLECSLTPPHRIEIHNEDGTTSYEIEKDEYGVDMTNTDGDPIYKMGLTSEEESNYAECVGKLKTNVCPFIPTNHRFQVESAIKVSDDTCEISVVKADAIINRVCSSVSSANWVQDCADRINADSTAKAAFCGVSTPQVSYDINEVNEILNSADDDYQCMQGSNKTQTIDATDYVSGCNDTDTNIMCASKIWENYNFCTNQNPNPNPNNEQPLATCDGLDGIESLCCHSKKKINLISGVREMCEIKNSMCSSYSNNAQPPMCSNEHISYACRFYNEDNYTSLLNVCTP